MHEKAKEKAIMLKEAINKEFFKKLAINIGGKTATAINFEVYVEVFRCKPKVPIIVYL